MSLPRVPAAESPRSAQRKSGSGKSTVRISDQGLLSLSRSPYFTPTPLTLFPPPFFLPTFFSASFERALSLRGLSWGQGSTLRVGVSRSWVSSPPGAGTSRDGTVHPSLYPVRDEPQSQRGRHFAPKPDPLESLDKS